MFERLSELVGSGWGTDQPSALPALSVPGVDATRADAGMVEAPSGPGLLGLVAAWLSVDVLVALGLVRLYSTIAP